MSIVGIIILIVLGIILVLLEFFVFPGVSVSGIAGVLLLGGSVVLAYVQHDSRIGTIVLISVIVLLITTMSVVLRSKTWDKIMLKTSIDSSVTTEPLSNSISPGDIGKTISRLAPMGKVLINNETVEAKSTGGLIDENTEIEVLKVLNTNIIVKPK